MTHAQRLASARASYDAVEYNAAVWHTPCIGRATQANVRDMSDDHTTTCERLAEHHDVPTYVHVVLDPMDVIA